MNESETCPGAAGPPRALGVQADAAPAAPPPADPPGPRRPGTESVLTLVCGVLASVGSLFAGTHSVVVTLIAVVTAVALAAMMLASRGRAG